MLKDERSNCQHCGTKAAILEVRVPVGRKWICEACGTDYASKEYVEFKRRLRATLDALPVLEKKALS